MLDRAHFCRSNTVFFATIVYVVGGWKKLGVEVEDRYVQSKLVFAGNFLFRGARRGDVGSHHIIGELS